MIIRGVITAISADLIHLGYEDPPVVGEATATIATNSGSIDVPLLKGMQVGDRMNIDITKEGE